MAKDDEGGTEIWKLFVAGAVTASGAAFFWWIHKMMTARREAKEEDLELEAIMLAVAASEASD